jgi:hypothetical protein
MPPAIMVGQFKVPIRLHGWYFQYVDVYVGIVKNRENKISLEERSFQGPTFFGHFSNQDILEFDSFECVKRCVSSRSIQEK